MYACYIIIDHINKFFGTSQKFGTPLTLCVVLFLFGIGRFLPYHSGLLKWHWDCPATNEATPKDNDRCIAYIYL